MIDINTIISNALTAAIQAAIEPLVTRIAALESANDILHRVQGERIAALETKLTEANLFTQTSNATITIDEARMVEALNSQEWFWDKLSRFVTSNSNTTQHIIDALGDIDHPLFKRLSSFMDAVAEQAMDDHCSTYDHDDYDNHIGDDDKHFDGDIEDAVRSAINGTSVTLSF